MGTDGRENMVQGEQEKMRHMRQREKGENDNKRNMRNGEKCET